MDISDAETSNVTEWMELEDMLGIEPLDIHLPFELNKQISCSVELTNDTSDDFAFRISTTSLRPYCIKANEDIVPPRSKCIVTISLQAMDKALPGHHCRDEFSVQSTRLDGGSLVGMNIGGGDIFNEEPGRVIDMVDFSVVLSEAVSPSPWTTSSTEREAPSPWTTSSTEREALSEQLEEDAAIPLAYQVSREANFILELLRYVVLLATLAASMTYLAGTSPPGGFRSDNYGAHLRRRYRSFFYCFITAFIAFIFIVSSLRWWLWTLGMFCIMGAFRAARSCWTLAISVLFARDGGKKVASETLVFAALVVGLAYQTDLMLMSTLDVFLSVSEAYDEHLLVGREPKLRGLLLGCLMVAFLCFNIMLSLKLLMRRTVTWRGHGFCSWALRACAGVALIGLTGAFFIWSRGSLRTSWWLLAITSFFLGLLWRASHTKLD